MRAIAAILFAAALMLGQTPGISLPAFADGLPPPDCTCGKSCCITDTPLPTAPAPAAPVTSASDHLGSAVLVPIFSWSLPADPVSPRSAPFSSLAHQDGVALYKRNCSFII
jgi:hypothetical protein